MKAKAAVLFTSLMALAGGAGAQTLTGSGTTNTVPVFTGSSTVGNSPISVSGGNVGIGTTTPNTKLEISGEAALVDGNDSLYNNIFWNGSGWEYTESNVPAFAIRNTGLSDTFEIMAFPHGTAGGSPTVTHDAIAVNGASGNVGIGTTAPAYTLDVAGQIRSTSGIIFPDGSTQTTAFNATLCGGDFAESVDISGQRRTYKAGDVLVLTSDGKGDVAESSQPYSTMVAGIFSTKPGYVGRRLTGARNPDEIPLAMVGIVPTNVSAENGSIHRGDLLVTSSLRGYAMKGTDRSRMLGAVVGKAMGTLESGTGVIEVLVTLQ